MAKGVPSRGSAKICKDDAPIREERSRDLPEAKSSPPPSKDADAEKNKLPDVETSISGEIADDMHQLSCLCDQAAALFDEEKSTTNEEGTSHLDVAPDKGAKVVPSDDCGGRAEAAGNDVGRDDAAPSTRDRNASVQQRTRESPAKHSTAGARATIEASPAHRPAANESPRKHLMAEARAKIKASRESPHKNLMAEARAKTRASPAHQSPCKHSTTEAVPKTKVSPFHREIPRKDPTAEDVPKIKASPAHQSPRKHSTAKAVSKINASPTHESPRKHPMAYPVPKAKSPTHRPGESNEKECSKKDGRDGTTINGKLALQKSQEKIKIASEALPPKEKLNLQNSIERVRRDCDAEISILNDPQSKQRPAEKEEGELDILPTFCMDGAMELSLGYIANRKSSLAAPAKGGRSAAAASGHEDVDAFFSRFSIPKDNGGAMNEIVDEISPRASEGEVAADVACSEKVTQSSSPELSDAWKNEHDSAESQSPGCDHETFLEGNDAQSVCAEEVPRKAEASVMVEEEPIGEMEQMEQIRQMEWKAQQEYELREKNKNLPKHLSLWKSPWQRNRIAHSNGSGTSKPAPTSGITAAGECLQMSGGNQRQCFLPPKKRLAGHTGYLNIDFYSLYEATAVQVEDEDIDRAPWEYRDVGQRFLHEKSVESRNWFGAFEITRGNDRVPNPVCRPKSLEVSVTKIPEPGDWSEDWYTTWQSRRDNPNNLVTFSQEEVKEEVVEPSGGGQPLTVDTSFSQEEPSLPLKRVAVEIGSLCPVRVKGGERVSRVHHDFTSSLRHSRWRKKYLVGSMFPRD